MGSLGCHVVSDVFFQNSRRHRHTLVRLLVGTAGIVKIEPGAASQVGCPVSVVIASIVGEAFIADLATPNMAKDPVAAGNEVAAGLFAWRVEAGAVADGRVGFDVFEFGHCDSSGNVGFR